MEKNLIDEIRQIDHRDQMLLPNFRESLVVVCLAGGWGNLKLDLKLLPDAGSNVVDHTSTYKSCTRVHGFREGSCVRPA